MSNMKMSAPWYGYYRQIKELFDADPEITVIFDEENIVLRLYVDSQEKVDALEYLLPAEKEFGNIVMPIIIVPANQDKKLGKIDYFKKVFKGNPNLSYIYEVPIDVTQTNPLSYIVFENKVCQYYNDNLADPHGNVSTLLECIAREVFTENEGVCFCTDVPKK